MYTVEHIDTWVDQHGVWLILSVNGEAKIVKIA